MRIDRRTFLLVGISIVFFIASYCCAERSRFIQTQKNEESRVDRGFFISDEPSEMNFWDSTQIGSLVIASSLLLAAGWIARR